MVSWSRLSASGIDYTVWVAMTDGLKVEFKLSAPPLPKLKPGSHRRSENTGQIFKRSGNWRTNSMQRRPGIRCAKGMTRRHFSLKSVRLQESPRPKDCRGL